jgi:predicted ABC-type ATPase
VKLSLGRVARRVKMGGHGISEKVVRRRFHKGIKNFFKLYKPVLDFWILFDNSGNLPHVIAKEKAGKTEIFDHLLYDKILKSAEAR